MNMNTASTQIRIRGRTISVPSVQIGDRTLIISGKWIKVAEIKDEEVVEGEVVSDPQLVISSLKTGKLRPDIFTFAQRLPEVTPKFHYQFEWDNLAVIPIVSFDDWWEKRLPQESRKNVRRAAKRGVVVKVVQFDDELAKGIHEIYSETPLRQGRRFWHFGKDVETVSREHATYLDRSEFLGAYLNEELIGFLKIVYVDRIATLFHILSKNEHHDKRPMNALIAKAVEVCVAKEMKYLTYGKYTYGRKANSPLAEFKRRNGFEQVNFPRYYIPLTLTGRIGLKLKIHRGLIGILPPAALECLLSIRGRVLGLLAWCFRLRPGGSSKNAGEGHSAIEQGRASDKRSEGKRGVCVEPSLIDKTEKLNRTA